MNSNGATISVIGIDPGETTGMVIMQVRDREIVTWTALEVQNGGSVTILRALLDVATSRPHVALEDYVIRRRAGRSGTSRATVNLVDELEKVAAGDGASVALRPAATVKPWATDERLMAAGIKIRRMGHARDAARHALYEAVNSGLLRDPLEGQL